MGAVEIRNRNGSAVMLDPVVSGKYPSWNPAGSRIYAGGYLVDSDGRNREQVVRNGRGSIGEWSPDGRMLAVAAGGDLLLFQDIRSAFVPPDKPLDRHMTGTLSRLRKQLAEGTLSREEYKDRKRNLWEGRDSGK